jgi:Immunity protein 10
MRVFRAELVAAEEMPDLNSYALVMAEGDTESSARLELSIGLSSDTQDIALGMDTYSLCIETGACYYGGIRAWSIEHDCLEVILDNEACRVLDVKEGFRVTLSDQHIPLVRAAMQRILKHAIAGN